LTLVAATPSILSRATKDNREDMMAVMGFEVFDGDGHVLENDDEIASYFEGDFADLQRFKTFGV
jgi:hypothetical protein